MRYEASTHLDVSGIKRVYLLRGNVVRAQYCRRADSDPVAVLSVELDMPLLWSSSPHDIQAIQISEARPERPGNMRQAGAVSIVQKTSRQCGEADGKEWGEGRENEQVL
jgi:hypothetical protein